MAKFRALLSGVKSVLYRRPIDELKRLHRWGPRAYLRCSAWAAEMESAAMGLPLLPNVSSEVGPPLEVWYLTGERFWYQTAFCAWSLAHYSQRNVVLNLVDDGSLNPGHEQHLRRLFPLGATLWKSEAIENLDKHLPANLFPVLRQRWNDYINIRKLTDIHLGSSGIKLVLDSDMLFFQRPDALSAWWDQPNSPCLMVDCVESYGYSRPLLERLAGVPLLRSLNVGICGLNSVFIDWDEVEFWCRSLVEAEGTSYFLEQALFAMLASRHKPVVLEKTDYITCPSSNQAATGAGVLQHYVADSKPSYFGESWKLLI